MPHRLKFGLGIFVMFVSLALPLLRTAGSLAATASDWKAGQIIDDGIFYNSSDMSVDQVQAFLNNKVPVCDTWGMQTSEYGGGTRAQYGAAHGYPAPYTCLKDYYENPTTHANNLSGNSIANGSMSAAQIIVNAAQVNGISVRVLLTILQKESAGPLITDTWPFPNQYTNAMGYGCPDTAPCDPSYAGFYNQVNNAAHQFIVYRNNPANYRHRAQQNNDVYYNPNISVCKSSTVFITDNATAGLYNYTPYQPNQAALNNLYGTGDSCSAYGNRNFWRIFTDWFGNTILPSVIKGTNSNSIYIQTSGYKFYVPSISVLQDFGLGTGAQTVSQATIDSIPTADSSAGLSNTLGNVIKSSSDSDSDGGSIYLVSAGKKYLFTTVQQMADFGFSSANIVYLPLDFINSIASGGTLSNYVQTPSGSLFQVSNDSKRLILDSPTYTSLNGSGSVSQLSTGLADMIPSGVPLVSRDSLIGTSSGAIYLLANNTYYYIPSPEVLDCWGFMSVLDTPFYKLSSDDLIAPINSSSSLSCVVKTDTTTTYLMNHSNRMALPSSYGFTLGAINPDLTTVANKLPLRNSPVGQAVQATNSPIVWYLENGTKKGIPSLIDLKLLAISASQIERLAPGAINALPGTGIKMGIGQVVRASDTGAIYVITSATTKSWIGTVDDYAAYGYSWGALYSFPSTTIDQYYTTNPNQLSRYLYTSSGGVYIMDPSGCYGLSSEQITAYGTPQSLAQANQPYDASILPYVNLVSCHYASAFVKSPTQPTVYQIDAGKKNPISSWAKLQSISQQTNPYIITLSDSFLSALPTGTPR